MLIKENAIVLPALLVAAELFLVRDTRPWRERADELVTLVVWMALFAVAFLWVRTRVIGRDRAATRSIPACATSRSGNAPC